MKCLIEGSKDSVMKENDNIISSFSCFDETILLLFAKEGEDKYKIPSIDEFFSFIKENKYCNLTKRQDEDNKQKQKPSILRIIKKVIVKDISTLYIVYNNEKKEIQIVVSPLNPYDTNNYLINLEPVIQEVFSFSDKPNILDYNNSYEISGKESLEDLHEIMLDKSDLFKVFYARYISKYKNLRDKTFIWTPNNSHKIPIYIKNGLEIDTYVLFPYLRKYSSDTCINQDEENYETIINIDRYRSRETLSIAIEKNKNDYQVKEEHYIEGEYDIAHWKNISFKREFYIRKFDSKNFNWHKYIQQFEITKNGIDMNDILVDLVINRFSIRDSLLFDSYRENLKKELQEKFGKRKGRKLFSLQIKKFFEKLENNNFINKEELFANIYFLFQEIENSEIALYSKYKEQDFQDFIPIIGKILKDYSYVIPRILSKEAIIGILLYVQEYEFDEYVSEDELMKYISITSNKEITELEKYVFLHSENKQQIYKSFIEYAKKVDLEQLKQEVNIAENNYYPFRYMLKMYIKDLENGG